MAQNREQIKVEIRSGTEEVKQVQSGVAEITEKMERYYDDMMKTMKEQYETTIRELNENQNRDVEET